MAVRCVIFFCIWIFLALHASGKRRKSDYGTWWQIFVKFKCGKVSFFLRRFGSRILHILCAFAALVAVLFDGHPPWPNDFHEPTNINKLHFHIKKTSKHRSTIWKFLHSMSTWEKSCFLFALVFFGWFSLQKLRIWSWDRSCRTTLVAFSPLASLVTSRRQNPGIEDVFVKDRGIGNPWLWEVLGCYSCYCGFGIKITSHFFLPRNWNFNALECLCSFAIVVSLPRKFKTFSSLTFKHFCHASHASQIDRFTSHHQFLLPTSHHRNLRQRYPMPKGEFPQCVPQARFVDPQPANHGDSQRTEAKRDSSRHQLWIQGALQLVRHSPHRTWEKKLPQVPMSPVNLLYMKREETT